MGRYYNRKGEEVETWEAAQNGGLLENILEDKAEEGVTVTTVFTGFNLGTDDAPKIFETIIHGGFYDGYSETYFHEEDAISGHKRLLSKASEPLPERVKALGDIIASTQETNPYRIAYKLIEREQVDIKNEK